MGILNLKVEETELTEEEADMIELVASVLDNAVHNLLNDLLFEFTKEVDEDNVLSEIELKYQSLGITVRFLDDRIGTEAILPKEKKIGAGNDPGYYV